MKNSVLLFCIIIFMPSICVSQTGYNKYITKIYGKRRNSTSVGTGTFIELSGRRYILTCYHCVSGTDEITVSSLQAGTINSLKIAAYDDVRDIALLEFELPVYQNISCLAISNLSASMLSAKAIAIGHPNGTSYQKFDVSFTSQNGTIKSRELNDNSGTPVFNLNYDFDIIPIGIIVFGGMSGAPIIVDNKVVGIISGSITTGGSIGWGIPSSYISSIPFTRTKLRSGAQLGSLKSLNRNNLPSLKTINYDDNVVSKTPFFSDLFIELYSYNNEFIKVRTLKIELARKILSSINRLEELNSSQKRDILADIAKYNTNKAICDNLDAKFSSSLRSYTELVSYLTNYKSKIKNGSDLSKLNKTDPEREKWLLRMKYIQVQIKNKASMTKENRDYLESDDSYYFSPRFRNYLDGSREIDELGLKINREEMNYMILTLRLTADRLIEAKGFSD